MRLVLGLALIVIIIFSTGAYGQTPSEFGYRFLPNKIIANTDVVMQVYAKGDAMPRNIDGLVVTSSDSSIIQILSIEQNTNDFITEVKIRAASAGTVNIALAAPGFSSQEIPMTIYSDNKIATKLLIKTTPNTFSTAGVEQGYVSVELANDGGIPIKARQDTIITLTTSDSNIINLKNTELDIKEGQYFAIGQFEVKKDGTAQISASASSMATVSSTVTVSTVASPKTVQLYVFPKILNTHQNSYGFAIAELQQNGIPVLATEDITLPVQVTNASGIKMINTSGENPTVFANTPIVIKKGSYWGYTQISVTAGTKGWIPVSFGMEGLWNVGLSTKGYLVSPVVQMQTTSGPLLDDHTAVLDVLPVLATGQKELIGVIHLEDASRWFPGPPVVANSDLKIQIDSSDPNTLVVDNVKMDKGTGATLIFGKVGSSIPVQPSLHVVTIGPQAVPQTYPTVITALTSDSLALVADPLLPAILTDNDFPLALYVTKSGKIDYFTKDLNSFTSPKDIFQTESKTLHQGDSIVLLNSKSLKAGSSTITISAGDYSTNLSIQSLSSKPVMITLDHPEKLFSNLKNIFSIQLLNSQQNPVFLEQDTQFNLVSNDPSILNIPASVVIKKGTYYSLFEVEVKNAGKSELAVLTSELPLAKFGIDVTSLTPVISLDSVDYVNPNSAFDATVTVQYNNAPLSGFKVDWSVQGAKIQSMVSVTDKDGKAKASLISENLNKVTIQASVSGGVFGTSTVNKAVSVNAPFTQATSSNTNSFSIMGINPLFIIIPGAAVTAGIILKKKNMLDGITEKLSLGEKFSSIQEKISKMREK